MRCDVRMARAGKGAEIKFQSLSGFLMRCDYQGASGIALPLEFQSLSGFLMRCDGNRRRICRPILRFNPYRVF